MNRHLLVLLLLLLPLFVNAQQTKQGDYYSPSFMRYNDFVYVPNIRTVQLYPEGNDLLAPILELRKTAKLVLHFDDMDADFKPYFYTFIHCDANWMPTKRMLPQQCISGYMEDRIYNYKFSFGTLTKYTHYTVSFPNENIQPILSGNYLLKVYLEDDPDNPVITKRFMILDSKLAVSMNIHRATVVEDYNTKQEIDFKILNPNYEINDPYNDLKVIICQNNRWDNAITSLKPQFIKDGELNYEYDRGNTFFGGNEFRNFDTRSVRFKTERIEDLYVDSLKRFNVVLFPDLPRIFSAYSTQLDINGEYSIKLRDEITDSNVECDYTWVHFTLPADQPYAEGNIYVFGQLSNWGFINENKMRYNFQTKAYEVVIPLKQGFYNYEYVLSKSGNRGADEGFIEGNYCETENDYTIYVYNRPIGSIHDQLVGIGQLKSRQ